MHESLYQEIFGSYQVRECHACKGRFADALKIPEFWWSQWYRRLNGYFGSQATTGNDGDLDGYTTWFRFLVKRIELHAGSNIEYRWLKINVLTRWNASAKEHIVVFFDPKPEIQEELSDHLQNTVNRIYAENPHSIYVPVVQFAVQLQEKAVWKIRDAVRRLET
ncbi:MAG: hypothetical protein Q9214_003373, partial [Letrouitia sp. 1 TL-2023]